MKSEPRRIDAFELWYWRRLLRVPWTSRRWNQSILKEINPEYSLEAPILWPPDAKNWLTVKDPDAGKDWRQEEKGTTEDEMIEWHHQLDGHEFEQGLGVGNGQGSLVCCNPWGSKELDTTEWLNWTDSCILCTHWLTTPSSVFKISSILFANLSVLLSLIAFYLTIL